jgi:cation:H+ antiporter
MVNQLISFSIGIVILLASTETFVKFAKRLSLLFKISPLVIGITIVAIGTSLPEFAVSVMAAVKGDPGLAFGNIIGSCITNVLFILPLGIVIGKLRIGTTKTQRSALLMLVATIIFTVMAFSSYPGIFIGTVLLFSAGFISYAEYTWGVQGRHHEDINRFQKSKRIDFSPVMLFLIPLTIVGIISGATMTVLSIESISKILGISTTILGLTVSAIATSLPELFTTLISEKEHAEKITIGNIIGSQIYNLLLVGGFVFLISGKINLSLGDWIFFFLETIFFSAIIFSYKGKEIPCMVGVVLVSIYLLYFLTIKIFNP